MAWHCKTYGGYGQGSAELEENAQEIYNILGPLGWTKNATAGMIGNMMYESGVNPWRWESDDVLPVGSSLIPSSTVHGYGLGQFTPAGKYINDVRAQAMAGFGPNYSNQTGSNLDGQAQINFIDQYADYIRTPAYPLTYAEYKASTQDPYYLAAVWLMNYERPGDQSEAVKRQRGLAAEYIFSILGGVFTKIEVILAASQNKGRRNGYIYKKRIPKYRRYF